MNIYIVYEIGKKLSIRNYTALENCLFGAVRLSKNNDIDKYKYSGYVIRFDREGKFSVGSGFDKNCIILGVDMSSSVLVDYKKKDILIIGKGFTQGLDDTKLTADIMFRRHFKRNVSFSVDNMNKTGLNGHVYGFNVDYDVIVADDILDIRKYLMKKNDIK